MFHVGGIGWGMMALFSAPRAFLVWKDKESSEENLTSMA